MIRVAEEIKKILQSQMVKSLISADTQTNRSKTFWKIYFKSYISMLIILRICSVQPF